MKTLEDNRAFVKAVFEVVNESGMDQKNCGPCLYFKDDGFTPICLIGRALAKLGLNVRDIRDVECESDYVKDNNSIDAGILLKAMGYDPIVVEAASHAQKMQDGRVTGVYVSENWGAAVLAFATILHKDNKLTEFAPNFKFSVTP